MNLKLQTKNLPDFEAPKADKTGTTESNLRDNTKGREEPFNNVDNRNPENSRISLIKGYFPSN